MNVAAVERYRAIGLKSMLGALLRKRVVSLIVFEAIFVAAVGAYNPDFVRADNWRVIFDNMALDTIAMVGTVFLLAAGRFDLSIDGVANLSGVTAGLVLTNWGVHWIVAVFIGLGTGLLVGLINGVLIERFGLNPLMTTLGTWWATTGIALGATKGYTPYGFPQGFNNLGQATVGSVLIEVWYAVGVVAVGAAILAFTRFGYHVYATGGEREASRLNGIKIVKIGILLYAVSGLLSGVVGTIFAARLASAPSTAFDGLALNVIAGAVIGGASLSGGRGSVLGGLLGLLLLNMLSNAAIYVGISPYWTKAISGTVLIIAVGADVAAERREARAGEIGPSRRRLLRGRSARPALAGAAMVGDAGYAQPEGGASETGPP
jgi:ribose transport system permease protein